MTLSVYLHPGAIAAQRSGGFIFLDFATELGAGAPFVTLQLRLDEAKNLLEAVQSGLQIAERDDEDLPF